MQLLLAQQGWLSAPHVAQVELFFSQPSVALHTPLLQHGWPIAPQVAHVVDV